MPTFFYKARDKKGKLVTGQVEAATPDELKETLFSQGFIPISVKPFKKSGVALQNFADIFTRVKMEDIMMFTRQFYTLFKAGVSMDAILSTIAKQTTSRALKNALTMVKSDVAEGASLSRAFGKHPKVFNELYVSMLKAGEEAGILEKTLFELVKLIEKEDEIARSVKAAILYPKIVITVLILAVTVLITFVVPKFSAFYSHYGADLPLATQLLITISNIIRGYWYIVLVVVIVSLLLFRRYYHTKSGRLRIDGLRLKLPVFGDLNMKIANARFGHILGALYKSGLAMPHGLEVAANTIGNEAVALEILKVKDAIQKGATLSDAMAHGKVFPPVVIEATAVGEKTGALDEMLISVADHYELEVGHTIKNLTTLLEPLLLVAIFGMVALLALSIFLPIWRMSGIVVGR